MKASPVSQNTQINFEAGIKLTTFKRIKNASKRFAKNLIDEPFSEKQIIKRPSAYTLGVCDCVSGGIWDGKKVTLFHIIPTQENVDNLPQILNTLLEKLGNSDKKLRGLLLGGATHQRSRLLFEAFESFMQSKKIPCTTLKQHKNRYANAQILFNSKKDEWLISNFRINQHINFLKQQHRKITKAQIMEMLNYSYNKIDISPLDNLYA